MELNTIQKEYLYQKLQLLNKSSFRRHFKLSSKDINYIHAKGMKIIEEHAYDFISSRLAPKNIPNDGKQTPMRGHPVFIAQHATATCCRNCLYKWHHIPKNRALLPKEERFIVALIITWLNEQIS